MAKTTLDDIAREADCSRATVYRYFPNRAAVVDAAVGAEIDRVTGEIAASADGATSFEDAVTAMFVTAAGRSSRTLPRCARPRAKVVFPDLSFEGGDRMFAESVHRFSPVIRGSVPPGPRVARPSGARECCSRTSTPTAHPS